MITASTSLMRLTSIDAENLPDRTKSAMAKGSNVLYITLPVV